MRRIPSSRLIGSDGLIHKFLNTDTTKAFTYLLAIITRIIVVWRLREWASGLALVATYVNVIHEGPIGIYYNYCEIKAPFMSVGFVYQRLLLLFIAVDIEWIRLLLEWVQLISITAWDKSSCDESFDVI